MSRNPQVRAVQPGAVSTARRAPFRPGPARSARRRTERRTVKVTSVAAGLAFPHAAQAIQITRRRKLKGKWSRETCYAITSLTLTQATRTQLAAIIRGHWGNRRPAALGPRPGLGRRPLPDPHRQRTAHHGQPAQPGHHHPAADGATSIAAALRSHARRPARPPPDDHAVLTGSAGPWVEGAVSRRFAEVATLPRVHPRWHQRRPWRDQRRPSCA